MGQFESFDNPLVNTAVVFLFIIFLIAVYYIMAGSSKSSREEQDVLVRRHLNALQELEKKVKIRKRNIDSEIPLKTPIKIEHNQVSDLYKEYLEREKYSAAILQKVILSLRNGKEAEGIRYLIAACKIWKSDQKIGKLLMALPILEDILIHLSREDFALVEIDSEHTFSDIDKIISFVLSSPIGAADRKTISEIRKMIHIKRLSNL